MNSSNVRQNRMLEGVASNEVKSSDMIWKPGLNDLYKHHQTKSTVIGNTTVLENVGFLS